MKILKEDLGISLLGLAAFYLAIYGLKSMDKNSDKGVPGQKDKPLPNSNVIQAINDMWEDKPFVKDFAKILSDEGDFDKLSKNIEKYYGDDDALWKIINSTDFKPNSLAKQIVEKLLKTSSYKKIKAKYKLTKEDEGYFAKLLLFTIMHSEFTKNAKQLIFKTLEKDWYSSKPNITGLDLTRSSRKF